MVTRIHQVKVSPVEAQGGYTATCTSPHCGWRQIRATRPQADAVAQEHQRGQAQPDPADQVPMLDGWAV